MKILLAFIVFLFLVLETNVSEVFSHMCHDPFRPRDHLVLVPDKELIRIEKTGEFRMYIENTFRSILREVRLWVESPAFDIEITPRVLKRLVPGERTFFLIKLKIKEGFEPGDYPLRISVEARSAELRPSVERIEVVAAEDIEQKIEPQEKIIGVEKPKVVPPTPEIEVPEKEMLEPKVEKEPAGEIVVRVERFVLAQRYYLYLIPILGLIGFLIWRKLKQR